MDHFYSIGTLGQPWGEAEKNEWLSTQTIERSYDDEVLSRIDALPAEFEVAPYGSLPIEPDRYPLLSVTLRSTSDDAPWVLITGGVHGYETSGVQGALDFLHEAALDYRDRINLIVTPCVSPWGYEVINRWNPDAVDPNRSFHADSPSPEAAQLMSLVESLDADLLMHLDLHETTNSDEDEFRPALAARDGVPFEPGTIPDGFYTVGDTENPQPEFQAAIVAGVRPVTHIAPADENGQLIGSDQIQPGVIEYPCRQWGLCQGMTNAQFTSTTEVYPDSPKATDEICNGAQVAAVRAALDFALATTDDGPR